MWTVKEEKQECIPIILFTYTVDKQQFTYVYKTKLFIVFFLSSQ